MSSAPETSVRNAVLVAGAFLIADSVVARYPCGVPGERVFWFLFGSLLLWLILRRGSRLAWWVSVVLAALGAMLFSVVALSGDVHAGVRAVLQIGQLVPLLVPAVRRHVSKTAGSTSGRTALRR